MSSASLRRVSLHQTNNHGVLRRSPRRLRTKTPSVNELSKKFKVSPKGKRRLEFKPQEPLKGKRFYLDLQCFRKSDLLVCRIKDLGGEVEDFLSKDVSYVITNRKDVDTQCSTHSPSTPSPGMSIPSPIPGTKSSSMKGPSPLSVDSPNSVEPKHDTRGKALMKKATGTTRRGTSSVLANARTWGVQLIQLDMFLEKIEQYGSKEKEGSKPTELRSHTVKQSSKPRVRKLNAPFIKVEDHSRHFKPLVHELKEWPCIYFDTPLGTCPFDPPKRGKRDSKVKQMSHKKGGQEEKQQKRGYCECCCSHYKDLDLHLRSDHHQTFARDDSNYVSLDALISRGPSLKDFLDKVRGKHSKKAQGQEHDREDNLDVSSQEQMPETLSSEERSNKLLNETTPVQTPQGSELNSDESSTRLTRSRSRSQIPETLPDGEPAGGTQLESGRSPLEEKAATHAATSVNDPLQSIEGEESHENKPEHDEERPTIRITRSANKTSASPQYVVGVPQTQNADSKEAQQPQKSSKSGSTVKGDSLSTASVHCSGDFVQPEIDEEPSPAKAVRVTRSKKNSMPSATSNRSNSSDGHDSGKDDTDLSGCPSRNGLPEGAHDVKHPEKDQRSAIKSRDDKLCEEHAMSEVNPAIECCKDTEDSQRFTKITRAKAKPFSKENGQVESDNNATQFLGTKDESSHGPPADVVQQDVVVTSADTSNHDRKRSSPRLLDFSRAVICAEETKEADESYSDKTESIELSQEPPTNTIRTQSMQVMLKNALSGTSSSTVTIIGSSDEPAGNQDPQSDSTDDESIEPPREYPLRNRLVLSVKEQTKDVPLGWEVLLRGTDSCAVSSKDEEKPRRWIKKPFSAIGAQLSGGKVLDTSVCHGTRSSKHNRDDVALEEREPSSSSDSPCSDLSSRSGLVSTSCRKDSNTSGSIPKSDPCRAIDDTAKSTREARRAILEETDEEESCIRRASIKKQGKAKRRRRAQGIISSDVSDSDSCNDSLIAHRGTPQTRGQDPDAPHVSPEPASDISSQKCSTPSATRKPDDVHNDQEQEEEWNIGDKLTLSASKLGTRQDCTLSQLFNSNDDEEEFYGFDVPRFDQSLSSEQDLSFHIESIVENMREKEGIPLDPLDVMSCEERCRESGERESATALVSECGKHSRGNDKQGLKDADESSSGGKGKGIEQEQETGKCLNLNLLDVLSYGTDYLKVSPTEGVENEVDVCENGDSSSTVADSTDGEDEEPIGLSPKIELRFRRRKREMESDFDGDTEIVLPLKRRKSEDETCEQSSPRSGPTENQPQETCKEIETGNAGNNETTAAATDCDNPRYERIQQDVVFSGREQLNMADEIVYQTLEERVKLRRSKAIQGRETVANITSKAEQKTKEVVRRAGKRQVYEELEQSAKKSQKPAEGRRNERRMSNAGVWKNPKTDRVVTSSRSASASEVGSERMRTASSSILSDSHNIVQARRKRPGPREGGNGNKKGALRPLRPLRRKSESTTKQAPSAASKTVKPLKPLRPLPPSSLRDMISTSDESATFSPRHLPESSSSSYAMQPRRLRSSGNWIFKATPFASPTRNGKIADSIPLLVTPGRRFRRRGDGNSSHQLRCLPSLRMGDQYEFVDDSGDVYDFRG